MSWFLQPQKSVVVHVAEDVSELNQVQANAQATADVKQ